jgi:tripartite-type tricarboxylate transporter receptor subunit TctC
MKQPISGCVTAWLLSAFTCFAASPLTLAAEYPIRPVRLVVPFPPGGAGDFQARTLAPGLSEQLRQPIVIDNRAGANGVVAIELVARSAADGYTLLLGYMSALTINPILYSKLSYDSINDFSPISMLSRTTLALIANPSFPAASLKELIALARSSPGRISYGSPGIGNANHLAGELLKSMTGVELVHVPYKGAAPVMMSVMGGQVPIAFVTVTAALPHVRAGKLKALVVTSKRRSSAMPDIPTVSEAGLPGLEQANGWFGILAPARTPKTALSRLNREIVRAMGAPEIHGRFVGQGLEPVTSTPDQFTTLIKSDLANWAGIIKRAGIQPE